jgi:tetratricopeptide (TPR) repeat protein
VLEASLAEVDVALAARATAPLQLARARLLRELGRYQDAALAYRAALALDATVAGAHHGLGLALAALDRHADAITEWEKAAAADPTDVDALYNAGLAHQRVGNAQAALASWRRALERAPRDFWILRKIIQAEYALERYDDAAKTRATLLEVWRTSDNPAVQLTDEFVFDQFDVDGVRVLANETLRPRDPMSYAIYSFRAEGALEHGPLCVQIETSDYAKERGVPFVISLLDGTKYRALGTSEALPPYPEIRKTVRELVTNALAGRRT